MGKRKKNGTSEIFSLPNGQQSLKLSLVFKCACKFDKSNAWNEVEQKRGGFKSKNFILIIRDHSEKDKIGFGKSERTWTPQPRIIWKFEINMREFVHTSESLTTERFLKLDGCQWEHKEAMIQLEFKTWPKKLIGDINSSETKVAKKKKCLKQIKMFMNLNF